MLMKKVTQILCFGIKAIKIFLCFCYGRQFCPAAVDKILADDEDGDAIYFHNDTATLGDEALFSYILLVSFYVSYLDHRL